MEQETAERLKRENASREKQEQVRVCVTDLRTNDLQDDALCSCAKAKRELERRAAEEKAKFEAAKRERVRHE